MAAAGFDNHQIAIYANYKNNKLHGTYISYDEKTGKELMRMDYDNGKAN